MANCKGDALNVVVGPAAGGLIVQDGALVTARGAVLLRRLGAEVRVREHQRGLVLGLQLPPAEKSSQVDVGLGEVVCQRFLALCKAKLFWQMPAWGASAAELPVETTLLLTELEGGAGYGLLLPLIDSGAFRGSLRPPPSQLAGGQGTIFLRMESGDQSVASSSFPNAVYVACGADPFQLIDHGIAVAARLSGSARPRAEKAVPPALDLFGWCSWDSFYTNVHPAGLQAGLASLAEGGTPAKWLLLDDGWQSTDVDAQYRDAAEGYGMLGLERQRTDQELEVLAEGMQVLDADLRTAGDTAEVFKEIHGRWPRPLSRLYRQLGFRVYALARSAIVRAERFAIAALKGVLEESSSDSLVLASVCPLLLGPLRRAVLRFYASASAHSRRLLSIKANAKFRSLDGGPEAGMAGQSDSFGDVVRGLKERYGLQFVICWHAMAGYWSGLMPGAPEMEKYGPRIMFPKPLPGTLEVDASMSWVHPAVAGVGLPREPELLHEDLHAYLASSGVDGVKVDVQATITMFGHASGGAAAIGSRYHASLERSAARHFPTNNCINSMCCDTIDIYNMVGSNWARCSEDFYPRLKASHTAHIANATFSSLFVGAISTPDFDMFQSTHETAHSHAALRAISGGPIYVSDHPGQHDFALLRRLVLPDGSVLRCALHARPTADCLFLDVSRDQSTVLKVWNANSVTGVVGAFNVQGSTWVTQKRNYVMHDKAPPTLTAHIRPRDVPTLPPADRYAVWLDGPQSLVLLQRDEAVQVAVAGGACALVTVSPVAEVSGVAVAAIGLVDMLNAGGAVLSFSVEEGPDGGGRLAVHVQLRGCGRFAMLASQSPAAVLVDGASPRLVEYDAAQQLLSIECVPCGESMQHSVEVKF